MPAEDPPLITAEEFRGLVESTVDPITLINQEGTVLYQNPAAEVYFGWKPEELEGKNIFDFVHPEDAETAINAAARIHLGEDVDRITIRFRHKEGTWKVVEVVASVASHNNMILNTRDVTEKEMMVQALTETHDLFSSVFNAPQNIAIIADISSGYAVIIDANEAFASFVGMSREECVGQSVATIGAIGNTEERDKLLTAVRDTGRAAQQRLSMVDHEGSERIFLVSADTIYRDKQIIHFHGVDITERELVEAQLRQSQRMEAVGQLTGGIAHDFNNILTVIMGYVEMSLTQLAEPGSGEQLETNLKTIRSAVERGSDLSRKLLAFSRKQVLSPSVIRVDAAIDTLVELIRPSLGGKIDVEVTGSSQWACLVDPGMFENAVMNIALNARDALPPEGGNLTIALADITLAEPAADAMSMPPGDYIKINIEDNGSGMDEETSAKVFEPFFSTKEEGHGTGLGLSMVFGFINQSGGHISVTSKPDMGTVFHLLLPRHSTEQTS